MPKKAVNKLFGLQLQLTRAILGMTGREFAKKARISHVALLHFERGIRKPALATLGKILIPLPEMAKLALLDSYLQDEKEGITVPRANKEVPARRILEKILSDVELNYTVTSSNAVEVEFGGYRLSIQASCEE